MGSNSCAGRVGITLIITYGWLYQILAELLSHLLIHWSDLADYLIQSEDDHGEYFEPLWRFSLSKLMKNKMIKGVSFLFNFPDRVKGDVLVCSTSVILVRFLSNLYQTIVSSPLLFCIMNLPPTPRIHHLHARHHYLLALYGHSFTFINILRLRWRRIGWSGHPTLRHSQGWWVMSACKGWSGVGKVLGVVVLVHRCSTEWTGNWLGELPGWRLGQFGPELGLGQFWSVWMIFYAIHTHFSRRLRW